MIQFLRRAARFALLAFAYALPAAAFAAVVYAAGRFTPLDLLLPPALRSPIMDGGLPLILAGAGLLRYYHRRARRSEGARDEARRLGELVEERNAENVRLRSDNATADAMLRDRDRQNDELTARLTASEAMVATLTAPRDPGAYGRRESDRRVDEMAAKLERQQGELQGLRHILRRDVDEAILDGGPVNRSKEEREKALLAEAEAGLGVAQAAFAKMREPAPPADTAIPTTGGGFVLAPKGPAKFGGG